MVLEHTRRSRRSFSRDHDGSARAAEFGEIPTCSHADLEPWALTPKDRTIGIGL